MSEDRDMLTAPVAAEGKPVKELAAEWCAFLKSGAAGEDDLRAFAAWMQAAKAHAMAFHEIEQAWSDASLAAMACELETENVAHDAPQSQAHAAPRGLTRRFFVPASIAACVALAAGLALWVFAARDPGNAFQYASAIGEVKTIQLEDGTMVTLSADSAMRGAYSKKGRTLSLEKGRAFFDVAREPARPFSVAAGDSRVVVLGTAFDIDRSPSQTRVTVVGGHVTVASAADSAAPASLTAGQMVSVAADGTLGEVAPGDAASLSWRDGRLAYVDARLGDVIGEVNRYRAVKIRLADPALAELRVTLAAPSDRTDVLLSGLETTMPVRVRRLENSVVIERADNR